jgi:hypothetical protein
MYRIVAIKYNTEVKGRDPQNESGFGLPQPMTTYVYFKGNPIKEYRILYLSVKFSVKFLVGYTYF